VAPQIVVNSTAVHSVKRIKREVNILNITCSRVTCSPVLNATACRSEAGNALNVNDTAPYRKAAAVIVRLRSCKKR